MEIMSIQMLYAISIAFVKKHQEIIFYFAFLSPNIWLNCQSVRLSPLISWGWLGMTYDSHVKRVSQRSAESRGYSGFLPQGMLTEPVRIFPKK
jgi:hypothetical protein